MPKRSFYRGRLRWQDLRRETSLEALAKVEDVLAYHSWYLELVARHWKTDPKALYAAAVAGRIEPILSPARPDICRSFPTKAERKAAERIDGISRSTTRAERALWEVERPWTKAVADSRKALDEHLAERDEHPLTTDEFEAFMGHALRHRLRISRALESRGPEQPRLSLMTTGWR